jgi:hypothetical protein
VPSKLQKLTKRQNLPNYQNKNPPEFNSTLPTVLPMNQDKYLTKYTYPTILPINQDQYLPKSTYPQILSINQGQYLTEFLSTSPAIGSESGSLNCHSKRYW